MAPHSSALAWKIPWTGEPGRLLSMGSLRVRYDGATSLSLFTFMHWRRKWQPTPVFLPGESQRRGSLVAAVYGVTQSWTRLKWLSSSIKSTTGDLGSIPGSGRSPGEGNGKPLQYPCLENSMDGGAWQTTVHGIIKSQTQLSDFRQFYLSLATLLSFAYFLVCLFIFLFLVYVCS